MISLIEKWIEAVELDIEIDASEFSSFFEQGQENDLLDLLIKSFPSKGEILFQRYLLVNQKVALSTDENGVLVSKVVRDLRQSFQNALKLGVHEDIENIASWVDFLGGAKIREVGSREFYQKMRSGASDMLDVYFTFFDYFATREIPFVGKCLSSVAGNFEEALHAAGLNDLLARIYILAGLGEGEMDIKSYPPICHNGLLIEILSDEIIYYGK